jgi:hypothetical protein
MKSHIVLVALFCTLVSATAWQEDWARTPDPGQTTVSISGEQFFINGKPTYQGRKWRGFRIEGLLMNSRMVQGIFDDLNPQTAGRWSYPDTGKNRPLATHLAGLALIRIIHEQRALTCGKSRTEPRARASGWRAIMTFRGIRRLQPAPLRSRLCRVWHALPRFFMNNPGLMIPFQDKRKYIEFTLN